MFISTVWFIINHFLNSFGPILLLGLLVKHALDISIEILYIFHIGKFSPFLTCTGLLGNKAFISQFVFEFLHSMMNGFLAGILMTCFSTDSTLYIPSSGVIYPQITPGVNSSLSAVVNDSSLVIHLKRGNSCYIPYENYRDAL